MDIKKVGKAISYLRKRAGYTQKELADRIGVSDKAVSKWERGLGLPDTSIIGKIAILLDTDTDSLLAGDLVHQNNGWTGLLVLDESNEGIYSGTVIYDKPLVYFQIGYFLLMGIREIRIVCGYKDMCYLKAEFGNGERLGTCLSYYDTIPVELYPETDANVMAVLGRSLIFGVDQTRFFQKAMLDRDRVTVLSLPRKKSVARSRIYFDSDKRLVSSDNCLQVMTQYNYHQIPILFFPSRIVRHLDTHCRPNLAISRSIHEQAIYTVVLDRGFVEIPIDTWNDVINAAIFVKTVQQVCGMQIYCIEEIAWRRGLITHEAFARLGVEKGDTCLGKYIRDIAGHKIGK